MASLFGAELIWATLAFDGSTLAHKPGALTHLLDLLGAPALQCVVACLAIVTTFCLLDRRAELAALSQATFRTPVRWLPFGVHVVAFSAFALAGASLYLASKPAAAPDLLTFAILVTAIVAAVSAALAAMPLSLWIQAAAIPGVIWPWALGSALLVSVTTTAVRSYWHSAANITFQIARLMLRPILPLSVVDPSRLLLGTAHFKVIVSPACSGLEGISLLLLFGSLWLILFRKECRFPQALLLLPIGAVLLFIVNAARIAALVLIGSAGARQIAMQGFHSQAGWMSFNAISLGLCVAARQVPWFTIRRNSEPHSEYAESSATAAYLMPLMAILAAGMIAHAMSGAFEWTYPLRVIAPLAVLWFYRRDYAQIDWGTSTRSGYGVAILAGILVLLGWIGLDRLFGIGAPAAMPADLRAASMPIRALWIGFRAFSAVVTVPIAEELAFRGYLMRRFRARDFDTVPSTTLSWPGLILSSAIFGLLHGSRWAAGTLAGLIYGLVCIRRGRLRDAILAHATTNALLAGAVLLLGWWQYW